MHRKPKIHSYFLFMQDMRRQIPGWENKGNVELQSLCDPLWRKLPKEEKERYKRMKKDLKMSDRLQASEEYKKASMKQNFDPNAGITLLTANDRTRVYLMDVLSVTTVKVAPEKEIKKVQKFLANEELNLVEIGPAFVYVGLLALARYSEDKNLYRCVVTEMKTSVVKISYIDFGNEEEVERRSLFRMPAELLKLKPLCVTVKMEGMTGMVRNTEKNIAKIEKKLSVSRLFISLNDNKEATFYDDEERINIKLSRKKEKLSANVPLLDTIEEKEELNSSMEGEHYHHPHQTTIVHQVATSVPMIQEIPSLLPEEKKQPSLCCIVEDQEEPTDVTDAEEINCVECIPPACIDENLESKLECSDLQKDDSSEETKAAHVDINNNDEISPSTKLHDEAPMSSEELCNSVPEINIVEYEGSLKVTKLESIIVEDDSISSTLEAMSSKTTPEGTSSQTTEHTPTESSYPSPKSSSSKPINFRRRRNQRNLNSNKNLAKRSSDQGKYGDWKVGDEVIVMWISDGVWRKGIIHEIFGNEVFVIAAEDVAVKATKVKREDLKSISIPIDFLNLVEDAIEKEVETKCNERRTYSHPDDSGQMNNTNSLTSLLNCDELIEDSTLDVLVDLLPSMDKSQLETLASMARRDIYKLCTYSSKSFLFLTTLLQFSCDQLRDEIMNEIVDKAEHLLRTDAGYSSLLDLGTSDATRMSAISSWICGNLLNISSNGNQRHAQFCLDVFSKMNDFNGETQIEEITRFVLSNKLLVQLARTSIGSCLLQKLIRIVVSRQGSLRNDVLQVLRNHVQVLCQTPTGVGVLKCLDGFI